MDSARAAGMFSALGQTTRVELLRELMTAGANGMPAGDIAARLAVPPSTLSFHLRSLEQAGLIQSTRQSRQIIYSARIAGLRALLAFLTETCCAGRPELCGDLARLLPDNLWEIPMPEPFHVLFLCTRNSARSIMAEAILNQIGRGRFRAHSAGSEPADAPMPEVLAKLQSLRHDVTDLRPKHWSVFTGPDAPCMDFVITLCDTLIGQTCPEFCDTPITAAWPLPDPAKFGGTEAEQATMLNELYGGLHRRLSIFTSLPIARLDRMALKARMDEIGRALPALSMAPAG